MASTPRFVVTHGLVSVLRYYPHHLVWVSAKGSVRGYLFFNLPLFIFMAISLSTRNRLFEPEAVATYCPVWVVSARNCPGSFHCLGYGHSSREKCESPKDFHPSDFLDPNANQSDLVDGDSNADRDILPYGMVFPRLPNVVYYNNWCCRWPYLLAKRMLL